MRILGIIFAFLITILMFWVMFVAEFQHVAYKIATMTVLVFSLGLLLTHIANKSKED